MKNKMTGVIIGRFQPLHYGHCSLIEYALKESDNVIVLLGSINQPRTDKNPYTFEERKDMILNVFKEVKCIGINDYPEDDEKWKSEIKNHLFQYNQITLYGYLKDDSSYYLNIFPEFKLRLITPSFIMAATDIRKYIKNKQLNKIKSVVPEYVFENLKLL